MKKIKITAGNVVMEADIKEGAFSKALLKIFPIEASASTWGEEIYFPIPIEDHPDGSQQQETVELGDLGYWPPGKAFCIFFGTTPVSRGDEIRPASAVYVFGKVSGNPKEFLKVHDGDAVRVEAV
jgi:hypothetical protein